MCLIPSVGHLTSWEQPSNGGTVKLIKIGPKSTKIFEIKVDNLYKNSDLSFAEKQHYKHNV